MCILTYLFDLNNSYKNTENNIHIFFFNVKIRNCSVSDTSFHILLKLTNTLYLYGEIILYCVCVCVPPVAAGIQIEFCKCETWAWKRKQCSRQCLVENEWWNGAQHTNKWLLFVFERNHNAQCGRLHFTLTYQESNYRFSKENNSRQIFHHKLRQWPTWIWYCGRSRNRLY